MFQTPFEGRFYTLVIKCGERYPEERPIVKFKSRIKMTCVSEDGQVIHFQTLHLYVNNWVYYTDVYYRYLQVILGSPT